MVLKSKSVLKYKKVILYDFIYVKYKNRHLSCAIRSQESVYPERNGVWKDTRDFRMLVILCLDLCARYRGLVPL